MDLGTASSWIGLVTGLFGGAVGGMLIAGPVARQGELARDRYRAESAIRGVVGIYRDTLRYDRDHDFARSSFPNSYTSQLGREEMTREVLGHADRLSRWQRNAVLEALDLLIGATSLEWILAYRHAAVSEKDEGFSRSFAVIKSLYEGKNQGLIQAMLRADHDGDRKERCDAVIECLDRIIAVVSPMENVFLRVWRELAAG